MQKVESAIHLENVVVAVIVVLLQLLLITIQKLRRHKSTYNDLGIICWNQIRL